MKRKFLNRTLSLLMSGVMVMSLTPSAFVQAAETDDVNLQEELRTSVSDEEYPNGLFGFKATQLSVNEGEETTITVYRQGNTDNEATVDFKAVDISAKYGEDYTMTVVHSSFKKEQLEASEDSIPLMEENAEIGSNSLYDEESAEEVVEDQGEVTVEEAAPEVIEENEAEGAEAIALSTKKQSGISAAYAIQNNAKAPEYDWQEVNPENASEDVTSTFQMGNETLQGFMESSQGINSTLTFEPGEYAKEIVVKTIDDDKAESDEQLMFFLYNAVGADIGADYNGYINIKDNEESVDNVFAVKDSAVTVNADQTVAEITIERTSGVDQMAFVTVGTKGNTAVAGVDYESTMQELIFPAGVASKTVEVPIIGDRSEDKTFYVGISDEGVVLEEEKKATLVTIAKADTDTAVSEVSNDGEIASKAVTTNIPITRSATTGINLVSFTGGINLQMASKVTVKYEMTGYTRKKKCRKNRYFYGKQGKIYIGNMSKNINYSGTSSDFVTETVTFSREMFDNINNFKAWDNYNSCTVKAQAWGVNDNSNAQIKITSVQVEYPQITFSIQNGDNNCYYFEKQITAIDGNELIYPTIDQSEEDLIKLGKGIFTSNVNKFTIDGRNVKTLPLGTSLNTKGSNSQKVKVSNDTVKFVGWKFSKDVGVGSVKYSAYLQDIGRTKIDKAFLNKYFDFMYNDSMSFELVPEFKPIPITLNIKNDTEHCSYNNLPQKKTITNQITKLDSITVKTAAKAGHAVGSIQLGNKLVKEVNNTTFGFGEAGSNFTLSMQESAAFLKVMKDPSVTQADAATEKIFNEKCGILYIDEQKNVNQATYGSPLIFNNVLMGKAYTFVSFAENGYRASWRDGTLDADEDGDEIPIEFGKYRSFTPVKGTALTYYTKVPSGRVYFSFEKVPGVSNKQTDLMGYVRIKDKYILTDKEFTKGVNGATVTANGNMTQTSYGKAGKKDPEQDGCYRIEDPSFRTSDYYLVNVISYGEEGSINTSFVANPGYIMKCELDTSMDLKISNAKVFVKNGDDYISQEITKDQDGYYSALSNGDKIYRIEMQAEDDGATIESGELQFYDKDGKSLNKKVEGQPIGTNTNGNFGFEFNPKELQLPAGTTIRVAFTNTDEHTYLQRELGMALTQSIGVLDVANSFTFGGANTIVKVIGKVDSKLNMGWNGDFDDAAGEHLSIDDKGNKIISIGYSKELIKKSSERDAVSKAKETLAKADDEYKKACVAVNEATAAQKEEAQKKCDELKTKRDEAKTVHDAAVKTKENKEKTTVSASTAGNLSIGFSFMMVFGQNHDTKEYYFKSMVLTASVEGGASITAKFATPVGITIDLGFAAGGEGTAQFTIEERKDSVNPKKYYITDVMDEGTGEINIFDCNMNNADRKFNGYGTFNLKPYIEISAGVGVAGLAGVSVSGKAVFDMTFYTTAAQNTGSVNLSSKISIELLGGLVKHSWALASTDINLFGNSGASSIGTDSAQYLYTSADILGVSDLSYMAGGSNWKNAAISAKSLDESAESYAESSIADKIAENPNFKMITIGEGEYLAVFTNTDPSRETINSSAVYYTVYTKDVGWSTPVKVEDDGTLDQNPEVFDLGTHGAIITWSTASKKFADNTSRVEMQNDMDLHGVFFDKTSKKLGEIQEITKVTADTTATAEEDNFSDYAADVAANVSYNDNGMVVYYEKKEYSADGAELLGDVIYPKYTVMAARSYKFNNASGYEGAWNDSYQQEELNVILEHFVVSGMSKERAHERTDAYNSCFYGQRFFDFLPTVRMEEKLDAEGYPTGDTTTPEIQEADASKAIIVDTDAMSYNNLGVYAYTLDFDGDMTTCADRDVYMQIYDFETDSFMHPIIVTNDTVEDKNIQFVRVQNETYLTWLHNGDIVSFDMGNIISNYKTLLTKGVTNTGSEYYYINKADEEYIAPTTMVVGEVGEGDTAISNITNFDVKASDSYVYFVWTQVNATLKDGIEEDSEEAKDPANSVTDSQMYVARYDVADGTTTKPVQVTSETGANYADAAFEVEGDNLVGLVYKAPAKTVTLDEYNAIIAENNKYAETSNGEGIDANDYVDLVTEETFVPYTVADIENAAPYTFRMDPKGNVKIKNAEFENTVAGESTHMTFDIVNDGVATAKKLTITAKDAAGNSVILKDNVEREEDKDGNTVEIVSKEIADSVIIDQLIGGNQESGMCQVEVPADAAAAEVTIVVADENGKELAKEVVTKELASVVYLSDLKAEETDVRNQYRITAEVGNIGTAAAEAGKMEVASVKDSEKVLYATTDYPKLMPGETYQIEQLITVQPNKEFTTEKDENGNVTETGVIVATAGSAEQTTYIERTAGADVVNAVEAITALNINDAKDQKLTMKQGESMVLTPAVSSKLADSSKEITGDEMIQYRYETADDSIISVENGVVTAKSVGTAEIKAYAYPKDMVFKAENKSAEDNVNSVLGTFEEAFISVPEAAVYSETLTVTVAEAASGTDNKPADKTPITEKPVDTTPEVKNFDQNGMKYAVTKTGEVTVTSVKDTKKKTITIPATVKNNNATYKVTEISKKAFTKCKKLQKVVIGSNVKKVGAQAFKNCTALKTVTMKNGVTTIEAEAFRGCKKLQKIIIPKNCVMIKKKAFYGCKKLQKVIIKSKKLKKIETAAFKGINSKAVFTLSGTAKQKKATKKLLNAKTGYKSSTMKIK